MKKAVQKSIMAVMAVVLMLAGTAVSAKEAWAEEILGEGQYIQTVDKSNLSNASYIKFDTLYYTKDKGYAAVKPEKDCYIEAYDNDGLAIYHLCDHNLNDMRMDERLEAGRTYYVHLYGESQYLFVKYDDEVKNTEDEAMPVNVNQVYTETIATSYDDDYYKFIADITGKAKIVFLNDSDYWIFFSIEYDNSGISLEEDTITEHGGRAVSINVREGDAYRIKMRCLSSDYMARGLQYAFTVVTAQVESIDFTPEKVSLNVQERHPLKPVILPELVVDNTVKYSSSDTNVATVDSKGLVYAKNAGTATIFCTAQDGSGTEGAFEVVVNNPIRNNTAVINALTNMKNGVVKVSIRKDKYAAGYQIQYAESKSMTNAKSVTAAAASQNIINLKAGKKYYFQARAYALDGSGNRIYSKYSAVKSIKVSKK